MKFNRTPIDGLVIIEPKAWMDSRGFFMETYNSRVFEDQGIQANFVQDNLSESYRGVLRGLHAQAGPQQQGKLVRVIRGRVYDVAVDIRRGSPTYGKYFGLELSEENRLSLWIPPGFLHGFLALEDHTMFTYKVTGFYDQPGELGVRWNDPDIGIQWPDAGTPPVISGKDEELPYLRDLDSPFNYHEQEE